MGIRFARPPVFALPTSATFAWVLVSILFATFLATPARAQVCVNTGGPGGKHVGFDAGENSSAPPASNCLDMFWCYEPELSFSGYEVVGECDPVSGACPIRAVVAVTFPGNSQNYETPTSDSLVHLRWLDASNGLVGACGVTGAAIQEDTGEAWIETGFRCGDESGPESFTLQAMICPGATDCPQPERDTTVSLDPADIAMELCQRPPPDSCGDGECMSCPTGGGGGGGGGGPPGGPGKGGGCSDGGGMNVRGGGASACPKSGGPGATPHYLAGGAGHPGFPGSAAWRQSLGGVTGRPLLDLCGHRPLCPSDTARLTV